MTNCLALRGISKSYTAGVRGCSATVHVLRDLDLEVAPGEIVALNSARAGGKTTLLLCAAGLLRPDAGSVSWFGCTVRRDGAVPAGIAYVSDRPFPYAFLSVREAVEYSAIARDLPLSDHATRVSEALDRTNLSAVAHRRVDALDGAQTSRLALASALLARPRLLIIDDLGSGCDGTAAREIIALLRGSAVDGAGVLVAGRLVTWLAADDAPMRSQVDTRFLTRFLTLADGRIEPPGISPQQSPIRGRTTPVAPARVAEWGRSSAAQNEAR